VRRAPGSRRRQDAQLEALAGCGQRAVELIEVRAIIEVELIEVRAMLEVEQAARGVLLQAETTGELAPAGPLARTAS
jgi:hypothetical protein